MKKLLYTQVISVCLLFLMLSCTEDIPDASTNTEDRSGIVDTTHVVDTINVVDTVKVIDTVNVIDTLIVVDTVEVFEPEEFNSAKFLGVWEEVVDTSFYYFANTIHRIEFLKNDSFNIKIYGFTDAIVQDDPCGLEWTHYAGGKIENEDPSISHANKFSKNAIFLFDGNFTDSTYINLAANCGGQRKYNQVFSISQASNDTLEVTLYSFISRENRLYEDKIKLVRATD